MKTYTITEQNEIQAYASKEQARGALAGEVGAALFSAERELAKLIEKFPMARLVDLRNSIPGLERVNPKTYKTKSVAVAAIWKAIQSLTPPEPVIEKPAERPNVVNIAERAAESGAGRELKRYHLVGGNPYRAGSKSAALFDLMSRPEGATWEDLHAASGWQRHVLRKFVTFAGRKAVA